MLFPDSQGDTLFSISFFSSDGDVGCASTSPPPCMSKLMPSALVMTGRKRSHSPISRNSRAKSEKSVDRSVMKMTGCPFFYAQVVVDERTLPLPLPVSSPNMNPRPELTPRILNATHSRSETSSEGEQ